jgi:23S rRNA pseudouridine1911/1915/1917 synthase
LQRNKKAFAASGEHAGMRADKFLASMMPEFSRAEIQRMEKSADNSHKLKAGETIDVFLPDAECAAPVAPTRKKRVLSVPIIYEDSDIIAVNKPRGMVMYPGAGNSAGTLAQELAAYSRLSQLGGPVRPGVVHRIDKDTSGVVILAKTDAAFRALVKTFSEHDLVRKYITFVWGIPTWTEADIEGNIARSARNRQKMSIVKIGGRPAKTSAQVVAAWPRAGISELKCTLFTGRTHQIRVHLSSHGFPVVGDPLYGRGKESKIKPGELLEFLRGRRGQCLHAEILELRHPVSGEYLKLRAPLPPDLMELKAELDNY